MPIDLPSTVLCGEAVSEVSVELPDPPLTVRRGEAVSELAGKLLDPPPARICGEGLELGLSCRNECGDKGKPSRPFPEQ